MTDSSSDEFFRRLDEEAANIGNAEPGNGTSDSTSDGGQNDDQLDLGEWDFGDDNEPIPPREWLLGNLLCRQFLTAIFADGAVGKTALIVTMALSLATGRNLLDEHVFVRCRVLLVSFEDGVAELRRG